MAQRVLSMAAFQVTPSQHFGELCAFLDPPDLQVLLYLDPQPNAGTATVSVMFLVNGVKNYNTYTVTTSKVSLSPPAGTTYTEMSCQEYNGGTTLLFFQVIQNM